MSKGKNRTVGDQAILDENGEEQEGSSVSDVSPSASQPNESQPGGAGRDKPARTSPGGGLGLKIYKPGQGYYTRICTAIGVGVLVACGAVFLFNELDGVLDRNSPYALPVQYGIPAAFIVIMGALLYWGVGLQRKMNDFFIATEGEMKKVNWSTRKEIVKSTKVVIVTVALMGSLLFICDVGFMVFFSYIGVLKGARGFLETIGIG
jgi:preprotein translocase SecE subunit